MQERNVFSPKQMSGPLCDQDDQYCESSCQPLKPIGDVDGDTDHKPSCPYQQKHECGLLVGGILLWIGDVDLP